MAIASAVVLPLAACGGGGSSSGETGDGDKSVTIWTSVDQPVVDAFNEVLVPEAQKEGITVKIQKVTDINTLIMTKLQAGNAPDIALIPQPGVVASIVGRNKGYTLEDAGIDTAALGDEMFAGALDAGQVDGKNYGMLVSSSVKSLVFYPKKAFDAAGYKAPESLDDLQALTDQIKSDGGTPWCFGIGSDAATGWPATDWLEDLVMRVGSVDDYKDWVTHDLPFDSDVVKEAGEDMQNLVLTDGNVAGGVGSVASTGFGDAPAPMFQDNGGKPGCYMLKQGTFISTFFPTSVGGGGGSGSTDATKLDANVGTFAFPPAEAGGDNPVLGAGDMATMLSNDDATKAVMKMMADKNLGSKAAATGSFLSPFKDFDTSLYPNNIMKTAAETAGSSSAFLFDASDAMPSQVGSGSFWKEMTAWISGSEDLDTALKNIDASWPAS